MGRLVFTNGVFRVPHAGHAWLLGWAKQQGDVLVVGVNDDDSARSLRGGQFILPLAERLELLAGLGCVDWVVPFSGADPGDVIRLLKPEVLVKGPDYAGKRVVGDDAAEKTLIAPEGPHPRHCTDLIAEAIVKGTGAVDAAI